MEKREQGMQNTEYGLSSQARPMQGQSKEIMHNSNRPRPKSDLSNQKMIEEPPRISKVTAELIRLNAFHGEALSMTGGVVNADQQICNQFPPGLLSFAKILPGNDRCPDCSLLHAPVVNNCLTWAK